MSVLGWAKMSEYLNYHIFGMYCYSLAYSKIKMADSAQPRTDSLVTKPDPFLRERVGSGHETTQQMTCMTLCGPAWLVECEVLWDKHKVR